MYYEGRKKGWADANAEVWKQSLWSRTAVCAAQTRVVHNFQNRAHLLSGHPSLPARKLVSNASRDSFFAILRGQNLFSRRISTRITRHDSGFRWCWTQDLCPPVVVSPMVPLVYRTTYRAFEYDLYRKIRARKREFSSPRSRLATPLRTRFLRHSRQVGQLGEM
jgi:hypothetical protein